MNNTEKLTIILLPGMDGTGDMFAPLIAALPSDITSKLVRYSANTPMNHAQLANVARAAVPREGSFLILGESFSGPIAINLAAALPKADALRCKGLILSCTFVRNPRKMLSFLNSFINWFPMNKAPAILLGDQGNPALEAMLTKALRPVSPGVMKVRAQSMLHIDVSQTLSKLTLPIMYLQAKYDRLIPATACEDIQALAPQTRVVTLPTPHGLLQVAPTDAANVITSFVRQVMSMSAAATHSS